MILKKTDRSALINHLVRFRVLSALVVNFSCCFLLSVTLTSCDKTRIFEQNQPIKDYKWDYADAKTFVVEIKDTTQHYNLSVNVRHSFQFDWRNAWVKIKSTFPDGQTFDKRVNLV